MLNGKTVDFGLIVTWEFKFMERPLTSHSTNNKHTLIFENLLVDILTTSAFGQT
jgi:hypothetical protein